MPLPSPTVQIRYGSNFSSDYFGFEGMPTPYLSRSQELTYYGGKWCQLTTLTLDGQVIGSEDLAAQNLNTIGIHNSQERNLHP
mgnify:FL=1